MAVPFRRTSKTRKRMRRAHQSLKVTGLVKCSNCGALIRSHHVCPKCGYYGGKAVLAIKGKEKESRETKKAARKTKKQASIKKADKETKDGQETKDE